MNLFKEVLRMMGKITDVIDFFTPTIYLIMRSLIAIAITSVFYANGFEGHIFFDSLMPFYIFYPFFIHYFNKIKYSDFMREE